MAMNFKFNILPILNKSEAKWKKFVKRIKFPKLSKKAIWGLAIGLGIPVYLIGLIIIAWYPVADSALAYAKGSAAAVQAVQKHMTEQKFRTALSDLADVSTNLEGLRVSLSIIPKSVRNFPMIKTQIDAVEFTVDSSSQLINAMRTLTVLATDILDPFLKNSKLSLDKLPDNVRREVLKKIFESPPILQGIRAQIGLADVALSQIPEDGVLSIVQEKIDPLREKLPQIAGAVDSAIPLAEILPLLSGYPVPKTYLFLLQNNTELRPTGGFLGAYGIMRLKNGNIDSFTTDNSYNLDVRVKKTLNVTPPMPLQKYNATTQWFFRDSNWSPDFPLAAKQTMWFYGKEGGREKLDGVIAITPVVIERLLEMTGSITIGKTEFTKDNVVDELIYQVEKAYIYQGKDFESRKGIIGDLGDVLIKRTMSLPRDKWPELFEIMGELANEKHMLLYSTDSELQDKIIAAGWGGQIKEADDDFIGVFDANLASLKTDAAMKRGLSYKLEQNDKNEIIATATLKYENTAKEFDWRTSRYRNYLRLLVPKGSELLESQGTMYNDRTTRKGSVDVSEDLGKTVFGTFVAIEPKETREVMIKYKLPNYIGEKIKNGEYNLLIQKQPGIDTRDINLELKFSDKIQRVEWLDNEYKIDNNTLTVQNSLIHDRLLNVKFQ